MKLTVRQGSVMKCSDGNETGQFPVSRDLSPRDSISSRRDRQLLLQVETTGIVNGSSWSKHCLHLDSYQWPSDQQSMLLPTTPRLLYDVTCNSDYDIMEW